MINSVIAADWSYTPSNRWYAKACRTGEQTFEVHPATLVPRATTFLTDVCAETKGGSILAGFDFPIGVPSNYAQKTGIASFRQFLQELAEGKRKGFLEPGNEPSLDRPFYPHSQGPGKHGAILSTALGITSLDEMLRLCDLKTDERGKAECIFFTMGPKQVGKAAISGRCAQYPGGPPHRGLDLRPGGTFPPLHRQ